jgi:translation initiation factor IF-1
MARDDLIQTEGVIRKSLGFGNFEIETKEGHTIQAKMAGRMKKYKIKIMVGDRVKVSISPYDVTHGIITYRL